MNLALGHNTKKLWKIVSVIAISGAILVALFVLRTLSSIPLDRLEQLQIETKVTGTDQSQPGVLESGAMISREMLHNFWIFGNAPQNYGSWLEQQLSLGSLRPQAESFLVEKRIELPGLAPNECQQIYCYQRRLPFEHIPSVFWKGLIGIEDVRFLDHSGVDFRSIMRAIVTDIKAMKLVQGGSTITQQLVKNLFLTNEKSFKRKIQEVVVAFYIDAKYPKENILEAYFNEVFWGAFEGIRVKGLYSAAVFYFQKSPVELDSYEAAILIALLKGPGFYHPIHHQTRLKQRVSVVYQKLKEMNLFYGAQEVLWTEEDWSRWQNQLSQRTQDGKNHSMWFTLELEQNLLSEFDGYVLVHEMKKMQKGLSQKYPEIDLGIKILMREALPREEFKKEIAIYSKFERSKKDAFTSERHQIGSTLKPIIFHVLAELGLDLSQEVSTEELTLKLKSGEWSPRETIQNFAESMTYEEALRLSLNRPIIRAVESLGYSRVESVLANFVPRLKRPLQEYPAQLLGAVELTMPELLEMYAKFIDEQCRKDQPEVLNLLIDPTKTTIRRQVKSSLKEISFFGKTGTSNDGLDNLFVFYDGEHLGVVWVGVESRRAESRARLYGSTTSFELYQQFALRRGSRFPEFSCHAEHEF